LDPIPEFIQRIIKLFDNAKIRNGIMLIGESGAGKTVAFNALCESLKLYVNDNKIRNLNESIYKPVQK